MKKVLFLLFMGAVFSSFGQFWVNKPITSFSGTKYTGGIMSVPSKGTIWVLGRDTAAQFNPTNAVCRSLDNGDTWTAVNVNMPAALTAVDIFALNKDTAFVMAADFTNLGGGMYRTTDGGTTWSRVNIFNDASSFPDGLAFFDKLNGVCFGDPINGKYEIYTTSDGGFTWTATPTANCPAPAISSEYGASAAIDVYGSTVYCGTNNGRVLKSTDKGMTWTTKNINITNWNWSEAFTLKNENELMIFGGLDYPNNGYAYSADGGDTWTLVNGTLGANIQGVRTGMPAFVKGSNNTYIITGIYETPGTVVSTDAGATWTKLENMATNADMTFLDSQTGYATSRWFTGASLPSVILWVGGTVANDKSLVYENVQTYPNPVHNIVNFETHLVKRVPVSLSLTDVMGKVIMQESYPMFSGKLSKTFYMDELPTGVYFIKAELGDDVVTEKIVKE